jgi:DNA-binding MarR family transcriptional regulator
MSPRLPQPDLGILIARAWQEFVRELHVELAAKGFPDLGRNDGYVFRTLARQPLTVSALAARLEITKQGAAQIIEDMERRGYVVRRPDPDDARARLVDLSPRGREAMTSAAAFHRRTERMLIRQHGPAAVEAMRATLVTLAGPLAEGEDPQLRLSGL